MKSSVVYADSLYTFVRFETNLSQFYVHLDDRANDLLTTTSVTKVTSDEYDNSGSTTAAKILA